MNFSNATSIIILLILWIVAFQMKKTDPYSVSLLEKVLFLGSVIILLKIFLHKKK